MKVRLWGLLFLCAMLFNGFGAPSAVRGQEAELHRCVDITTNEHTAATRLVPVTPEEFQVLVWAAPNERSREYFRERFYSGKLLWCASRHSGLFYDDGLGIVSRTPGEDTVPLYRTANEIFFGAGEEAAMGDAKGDAELLGHVPEGRGKPVYVCVNSRSGDSMLSPWSDCEDASGYEVRERRFLYENPAEETGLHFGYAFGVDDEENYLSEIAAHSDFVHINTSIEDPAARAEWERAAILEAAAHGLKVIINAEPVFFTVRKEPETDRGKMQLYSDAEARWRIYAEGIAGVMDHVLGFYIIDEPFWNAYGFYEPSAGEQKLRNEIDYSVLDLDGIERMLRDSARLIKSRFPQAVTSVGVNAISLEGRHRRDVASVSIPPAVDWVGLNHYYLDTSRSLEEHKRYVSYLLALLRSQKAPRQEMVLFTDGLSRNGDGEEALVEMAAYYEAFAAADPHVAAVAPFRWQGMEGIYTGVRDMPLLRDYYRGMFERIQYGSGPVLVDSEDTRVEASFRPGQLVHLRVKVREGRKIWLLLRAPSLWPELAFARPSDDYCRKRGRYVFPFTEGSGQLYYAESSRESKIDFGVNDFRGVGELVIIAAQGEDPGGLEIIQKITLTEMP